MKVLLYEPYSSGHRETYLKYFVEYLTRFNIDFCVFRQANLESKNLLHYLENVALENKCNLVHLLTFDDHIRKLLNLNSFIAKRRKIPILANYYLYNNLYEFPKSFILNAIINVFKISYLLVSDECFDVRNIFPLNSKKYMYYVPDTWNPDDFCLYDQASSRQVFGIDNNATVFLMFGSLSLRKGFNFFLHALDYNLNVHKNSKIVGLAIGRLDELFKEKPWDDLISALFSEQKLILIDKYIPEREIGRYFSVCDVVVCPYPKYFKVSSGTFTRACAAGKPSIVPEGGNLAYVVNKHKLGKTFDSESLISLAECMNSFNPDLFSDSMSKKKLFQYANERDINAYFQKIIALYKYVCLD